MKDLLDLACWSEKLECNKERVTPMFYIKSYRKPEKVKRLKPPKKRVIMKHLKTCKSAYIAL